MKTLKTLGQSLIIGFAVYPIIFLGAVALIALQVFAEQMHISSDTIPLLYALVFAVLTIALVELLNIASVVLVLTASATLIEYAQILIPGRSASAVDFVASLAGVICAAVLVWLAHSFAARNRRD